MEAYLGRRYAFVEMRSGQGMLPVVIGADSTVGGQRRFRYGLYVLRYSYEVQLGGTPQVEFVGFSFAGPVEQGEDPRRFLDEQWNAMQQKGI